MLLSATAIVRAFANLATFTSKTNMKRSRRRLPVPQHEFGFTPDTFNLIQEIGIDGDRINRERAEADRARRHGEAAQVPLFATPRNEHE
jgi:hypothetical protein